MRTFQPEHDPATAEAAAAPEAAGLESGITPADAAVARVAAASSGAAGDPGGSGGDTPFRPQVPVLARTPEEAPRGGMRRLWDRMTGRDPRQAAPPPGAAPWQPTAPPWAQQGPAPWPPGPHAQMPGGFGPTGAPPPAAANYGPPPQAPGFGPTGAPPPAAANHGPPPQAPGFGPTGAPPPQAANYGPPPQAPGVGPTGAPPPMAANYGPPPMPGGFGPTGAPPPVASFGPTGAPPAPGGSGPTGAPPPAPAAASGGKARFPSEDAFRAADKERRTGIAQYFGSWPAGDQVHEIRWLESSGEVISGPQDGPVELLGKVASADLLQALLYKPDTVHTLAWATEQIRKAPADKQGAEQAIGETKAAGDAKAKAEDDARRALFKVVAVKELPGIDRGDVTMRRAPDCQCPLCRSGAWRRIAAAAVAMLEQEDFDPLDHRAVEKAAGEHLSDSAERKELAQLFSAPIELSGDIFNNGRHRSRALKQAGVERCVAVIHPPPKD